ncbi:MAG: phosphate ABC transporter permease subunit PstC [Leptospirillia bacterium]
MPLIVLIVLLASATLVFFLGRRKALFLADGQLRKLHSLPVYYGLYAALWCALPALLVVGFWVLCEDAVVAHLVVAELPPELRQMEPGRINLLLNDIRNLVAGNFAMASATPETRAAATHYLALQRISHMAMTVVGLVLAVAASAFSLRRIQLKHRARNRVEGVIKIGLIACASVAIFTTLGIVLSVLFESLRFFHSVPVSDFLFGLTWSPQMAIREDQVGSSGAFGAVPLFAGTLLISFIAMCVAVPVGLMSAIYLAEYASRRVRAMAKPLLEILAGIPTVVYGFFAALTVAPMIRDMGGGMGLKVASESALAAGLVMGIMIIPLVSSLSDDVINAVPQSLKDGALGLGATQSETVCKVVFPAALPGIVGGILLAVSRAIGETMIVVMAAGLAANLTANPLEAVTTVTVQIVTLLTGDQEFDSPKTLAAFALGLMLFVVTLILNVIALKVVRKYREQYD